MRTTVVTLLLVLSGVSQQAGGAFAPTDLTLTLDANHQRHDARIRDAAAEAISQYAEWFGPAPFDRLTIVSIPAGDEPPAASPGHVTIAAHWLQAERSLQLEAAVARAVAAQWWGVSIAIPEQSLADGIAEYAQSRTLERIYDRRHQRLAYSTYEARYFGGLVPWAIRALRLDRQTAGIDRGTYRRHPDVDLREHEMSMRSARAAKVAAALLTLERYIGWPALQRGLSLAAERYRGRSMGTDDFTRTIGDASDRDLSWFFDPLFKDASRWDYAVASLAIEPQPNTACGAGPCIRSTIVVERRGNAIFSGTSHQPSGGFDSGRAVEIEIEFADGQKVTERWDGRATTRTIVFEGPSPATRASIDPRDVLALDLTRLNNTLSTAAPQTTALATWSVRWTVWLQDLLLTNAFFY
ncbi:MAG TPA: hypothetical protein VF491_20335 [Vicinamibacterales bacterium]|jgi:hypothetical protein